MKDLGKVVAVIVAIATIKRMLGARRVCTCVGPFCVCSTK